MSTRSGKMHEPDLDQRVGGIVTRLLGEVALRAEDAGAERRQVWEVLEERPPHLGSTVRIESVLGVGSSRHSPRVGGCREEP